LEDPFPTIRESTPGPAVPLVADLPDGFEHWSAESNTVYAVSGNRLRLHPAHLLTSRLDPGEGSAAQSSVMLRTGTDSRAGAAYQFCTPAVGTIVGR